mgnify:CR=1 FL=1
MLVWIIMLFQLSIWGSGKEIGTKIYTGTGVLEQDIAEIKELVEKIYDMRNPMEMSGYEYGFCNYTLTVSDLEGNDIFIKDDEVTCDKLDELKENEYLITYENEEYGTWLTTEFEVDDDILDKFIVDYLKEHISATGAEALHAFFAQYDFDLDIHTSGISAVCTGAVGEGIAPEDVEEECAHCVYVFNNKYEEIDLD